MHCTQCPTPQKTQIMNILTNMRPTTTPPSPVLSNSSFSIFHFNKCESEIQRGSSVALCCSCSLAGMRRCWCDSGLELAWGCASASGGVTQQEPNERTKRSLMQFTSWAGKLPWPASTMVLCTVRVQTELGGGKKETGEMKQLCRDSIIGFHFLSIILAF